MRFTYTVSIELDRQGLEWDIGWNPPAKKMKLNNGTPPLMSLLPVFCEEEHAIMYLLSKNVLAYPYCTYCIEEDNKMPEGVVQSVQRISHNNGCKQLRCRFH